MKKNLIYLVMDAVRPDYLGCYGNDSILTTEIDKLAKEGTLFENVITSAPWTIPSIATHLTGIYPHKLRVFSPNVKILKSITTIFKHLKDANYTTAAYFDSQKIFDQWSDSIDHYAMSLDIINLLNFISEHKNDRFFIFNLYRGTHLPYVLKYSKDSWYRGQDEAVERFRSNKEEKIKESQYRYSRAIENFSEWYLRSIIDRLIDEDILDQTAIIITSDHGESWGERISEKSKIEAFTLHGFLMYNDVLKVPLICYNLGKEKNHRIKQTIRSVDILPTILDAFNLPVEGTSAFPLDGVSLKQCLDGNITDFKFPEIAITVTTSEENPKDNNFSIMSKFSAIKGKWKLIWSSTSDDIELYNLEEDPNEQNNCFSDHKEVSDELLTILKKELATIEDSDSEEEREFMKKRLKELGYI